MVAPPGEKTQSLKAICPVRDLYEAVQTVGHAVSGRTSMQILSHVLIETEANALRVLAYDSEISISCRIEAAIEEPGTLTAPAKPLTEVMGHLPDKRDVALSVDRSNTVHLHCDNSDYKILGLPGEEYLRPPEVKDTAGFSVARSVFREMVRQTLFAVSTDETRRIITGILMVIEDDMLKMVATDTHRLAVRTSRVADCHGAQSAIVPARAMVELSRILTDAPGNVQVTISGNQIRFALVDPPSVGQAAEGAEDAPGDQAVPRSSRVTDVQITCTLIDGQYPNYQRVVPSGFDSQLEVPTYPLMQAVRRALIVARENSNRVTLRTDGESLEITAESSLVGNAKETLDIVCEGGDIVTAFNARYLLDVLGAIETEGLKMQLSESGRAGVIRPVPEGVDKDQSDYLCVLMPMQVV